MFRDDPNQKKLICAKGHFIRMREWANFPGCTGEECPCHPECIVETRAEAKNELKVTRADNRKAL